MTNDTLSFPRPGTMAMVRANPNIELADFPHGIDTGSRPCRRPPTFRAIAKHHGMGWVSCIKCGPDVVTHLERAHVIERSAGGLDTIANFHILCRSCHKRQPIFLPGEEEFALSWFHSGCSALLEDYEWSPWWLVDAAVRGVVPARWLASGIIRHVLAGFLPPEANEDE